MSHTNYEVRYAIGPDETRQAGTEKLRSEFLIEKLFEADQINLVYSHYDRYIAGGTFPASKALALETIDPLKSENFLDRREIGIINVGGEGKIWVDGVAYDLNYKEALYIGSGTKDVVFESKDLSSPAKFYINSAPAHQSYPTKKVTREKANILNLGTPETANARTVNQMIVSGIVDTCQLQMGMTELKSGSVWNTMPAHVHDRRMEVYFYIEVPKDQSVCHFMGPTDETRHIWMQNEQAVISAPWSIHSGAGTSNYTFIWGMAGENLDYGDMDVCDINQLK
ncbi:4-deoxy-L-threo-5-hexosulose-uronate ketol-isomerase [Reichenbachiella faecimaris]|uniref:4-deoxy-L-threo-5-hexosulose-uronate ketol-isomerase n=1 Tax=Reichenbachiella faecimaris TaxID=692418 RepID=A0A1W2G7F8_REIFA|nr:5-dehydro-4-deoxy-D-glucuronate isomerase [Reichenbachiella faecimaris]SMD32278.1 4-deoxy-L-threo-5-hexosulose-uronate ketol-isomerase [Reichenbachiella faecimaris]